MALATVHEQTEAHHLSGVFGIITKDQNGNDQFEVTNTVPLIEGQYYGWMIALDLGTTKVKWKEVFELPAKPGAWSSSETSGEHKISEDGRIATTEKEIDARAGYIERFWIVEEGDPLGDHVIRVYANDVLLKTFRFKVVKAKLNDISQHRE